jgi:hypothetical protein
MLKELPILEYAVQRLSVSSIPPNNNKNHDVFSSSAEVRLKNIIIAQDHLLLTWSIHF